MEQQKIPSVICFNKTDLAGEEEIAHLSEAYAYLGKKPGDYPVTERYAAEVLSLPMYNGMTKEEQDRVIDCINRFRPEGE